MAYRQVALIDLNLQLKFHSNRTNHKKLFADRWKPYMYMYGETTGQLYVNSAEESTQKMDKSWQKIVKIEDRNLH